MSRILIDLFRIGIHTVRSVVRSFTVFCLHHNIIIKKLTITLGHPQYLKFGPRKKSSVHFKVRVEIIHLYTISSWPFIQETSHQN